MAKRFTDTGLYKKVWFRRLSPTLKCLYEFILKDCDISGVMEFDPIMVSMFIGDEITWDSLDAFGDRIMRLGEDKIFVPGFVGFQYGKLSHTCKPHKPVIKLLEERNLFDKIPGKVIERVSERLSDNLEEKEKEKEKDKEKEKNKVSLGLRDALSADEVSTAISSIGKRIAN